MNADEKRAFIQELCSNVAIELQKKVDRMPAEWDGHELRKLIAEKFGHEVTRQMQDGRSTRVQRFKAEVYNRNIW